MVLSVSFGKQSIKDAIPYELKGRMTWDPKYRAKHERDFPPSESESDDDYSDEDEFHTGPYVSGGLQPGQAAPSAATARPVPSPLSRGKAVAVDDIGHDGFTRVSYKRAAKPRVPRRMNLNFNRDNTAKAAFRKREPHTGEVVLPRDCNEIEPSRAKMYDYLEELGVRMGSFIRPPQHIRDRTLLLWGNAEQIKQTKVELRNWLLSPNPALATKGRVTEKFADVYSTKGDVYRRSQKKFRNEADIRRFQQEPAEGIVFNFTGSFLWPVDEVTPTDLLGASLEALDPLRTQFQCHIIFDARLSVFRILTNDEQSVRNTLIRIQGVMKEYAARVHRPLIRYYIEPPDVAAYREEIKTVPSDSLLPNSGSALIPLMTGKTLEPKARNKWMRQKTSLKTQSDRGVEEGLRRIIPNLRFYRGQIRLRVHFGTFALSVFRWPETAKSITFEDFMKNMALPGTKGTMIRDLHIRKDAASVMSKVHAAEKLFQPTDNFTESLQGEPLCFSAYLECQEQEKQPLRLEVGMICNAVETRLYEKSYARWSKGSRRESIIPLEVFMIRLDGSPSWKLQASSDTTLDMSRITPKMKDFAESVKLNKVSRTRVDLSGEKVFDWDRNPGSMMVINFQQKTSVRYRLVRNPGYIIEISRYDIYESPTSSTPKKTNWGANLWNQDWDSELVVNAQMGIGEAADWDPRLTTFFPTPFRAKATDGSINEGLKEFLQIAREVNDLLYDIKKELPHLRG